MDDPIEQCILNSVVRTAHDILKHIESHFRGKDEREAVIDLWYSFDGDREGLAAALMRIVEYGEERGECAELASTYHVSRSTVSRAKDTCETELACGVLQGMKEVIEESDDDILHELLPEIDCLLILLKIRKK